MVFLGIRMYFHICINYICNVLYLFMYVLMYISLILLTVYHVWQNILRMQVEIGNEHSQDFHGT